MNYNEGRHDRQPSLPPFSSRTLHHPSFLPLYLTAGFGRHHTDLSNQTVHPIIPAEFFYTDPTMSCGRRVPNIVSDLRVFDCFQLNTPPPVMSTCLAPPTRPDPFRSAPHPTRDLGSLTVKINPLLRPPVQPSRIVLQLTQEEDQVITNLLKLHHQEEPVRSDDTLTASQMDLNPIPFLHPELMASASAGEAYEPFFCSDVRYPREASLQLQQGRCWSDTELEAANTLLSCFSLTEKDEIWGQNHNKPAATLPDPLPYQQNHEDSSISTETQQGSETPPASITTDCAQNNYISFSCAREHGEPGWGDLGFVWVLSESEGDAVHVLLSLGDTVALDIVQ
ncbi:uncharacterized protein LOC141760545 [Sebastes fasciatus]|uniref:uncharacterized protein LOC141760545 n=1 Tax=Sebastes fasciatus TaxID=394691 RepID=UPI003D9EE4A9